MLIACELNKSQRICSRMLKILLRSGYVESRLGCKNPGYRIKAGTHERSALELTETLNLSYKYFGSLSKEFTRLLDEFLVSLTIKELISYANVERRAGGIQPTGDDLEDCRSPGHQTYTLKSGL